MNAFVLLVVSLPVVLGSPFELRHDDEEWTPAKLEGISDVVVLAKVTSVDTGERRSRNDHVPTLQKVAKLEPVTVYKGEPRADIEFRFWAPEPKAERKPPWPDFVKISPGQAYIFYLKDNTEFYYPALQGKFDDGASVREPAVKQGEYKMNWDF